MQCLYIFYIQKSREIVRFPGGVKSGGFNGGGGPDGVAVPDGVAEHDAAEPGG